MTFSSPVPEEVCVIFANAPFSMWVVEHIIEPGALDDDARSLRRFDGEGRNLVHSEFGRGEV